LPALVLGIGITLLAVVPVYAASDNGAVELIVQPSLCVLAEGESVCRDQVKINWRAPHSRSLCLYESGEPDPLDCWQQTRSGSHTSVLEAESDVQFQLVEASGRQVVASRAFEVVADAKRYRRRRRNPWSFF
jgi:hypothetical protein